MRIVAGAWRGRTLVAPPGQGTRPTADRARQALFDMLMHAKWGGRSVVEGAVVADVFAGTGALGLEALSRGAARAVFIESDQIALRALRTNVAACGAQDRSRILATDALGLSDSSWSKGPMASNAAAIGTHLVQPERAPAAQLDMAPDLRGPMDRAGGGAASLVFLDPPYGQDLVPRALARLKMAGCVIADTLVVAETRRDETWIPAQPLLAERHYGAARFLIFYA